MRKFLIIIFSIFATINTIELTVDSNAISTKKKWHSGLKISNFGIYSLGNDLTHNKMYYPLRGKNWIYSGDTFGFEASNELYNIFAQYDIKMQILIAKGIASKLKTNYDVAEHGTFNRTSLNYISKVYGRDDFWDILNGKIYVKSKKGCTIKIKFSQKYINSDKWMSYSIKVKVKRKV